MEIPTREIMFLDKENGVACGIRTHLRTFIPDANGAAKVNTNGEILHQIIPNTKELEKYENDSNMERFGSIKLGNVAERLRAERAAREPVAREPAVELPPHVKQALIRARKKLKDDPASTLTALETEAVKLVTGE